MSKTDFIKEKLKQAGIEDYSEQDLKIIKTRFIEELFIYKDKDKAFQKALQSWKMINRR